MKNIILIVLNNFKNDSRVLKESVSLKNAGYNVKVVALYEDLLSEFDNINGIDVHRIKLKSKNWSKNKLIQILKYMEFMYKVIKLYRKNDIFHCNDLDTLPIGVIIKLFFNKKAKLVYDAHEFEINQKPFQSKLSIKLNYFLEKKLIKYTDTCFTVSQSIASEYNRLYRVKPVILFNAPNFKEPIKTDKFRENLPIKKDSIILLYQGGLMRGRGLELWIEAFKRRKDDKVVMVFMGYGELEEDIKKAVKSTSNIFYHPAVSPDVVLDYTAATTAAVSYIYNSCLNYYYCMPNKLFEYTMVGLPVIVSNLKDMGYVVKKYKLGVVVNNDTIDAINLAIDELLGMDMANLRCNALKFAKEYCWENQEIKMLNEYKKLDHKCVE
ncbi:glycosyltransferase [Campylobacter hyointestinalis]|uniref:glycosyltransferase n=1 Tax=Campylobacter hyointestinalis TaxID=198 RepID=UPI00072A60F6|nr:glycosyltransferase [Campylobacter hyointestinalis]CUU85654.1 putative glycosyl transferase [Campylobacter hyointestinalis subsp. hyointestinalis]CUU86133.1 putative glycosyl transferase [Campylobacter hyointestinalis subsp. hyointestinalis]